jgi:hypothetical protein
MRDANTVASGLKELLSRNTEGCLALTIRLRTTITTATTESAASHRYPLG